MNVHALKLARELRREGISADIGDESFRLKKSFELAEKAGARYIVIVGENEVASRSVRGKEPRERRAGAGAARASSAAYLEVTSNN